VRGNLGRSARLGGQFYFFSCFFYKISFVTSIWVK
jgi:hypothetical protein